MTTTAKYWDLAGTSLNELAWNIRTRGGSRMGTASPRGENMVIPHRYGRRPIYKYRDSRIISLPMWVRGAELDGSYPVDGDKIKKFDENWELLANLFDFEGQRALTKRWLEAGSIKSATAMVEYSGGLEPETFDPGDLAFFEPELLLADPWFYEAQTQFTFNTAQGAQVVNIRGNKPTDRVTILFSGGTNARLSWTGGRFIQINGGITSVEVNLKERSAFNGATYVNASVSRDRLSPDWGILDPGSTTFTLTGGGSYTLYYQAAFR